MGLLRRAPLVGCILPVLWLLRLAPLFSAGHGLRRGRGFGTRPNLRRPVSALFLREGLVFLTMALGPLAFLISASMTFWNR